MRLEKLLPGQYFSFKNLTWELEKWGVGNWGIDSSLNPYLPKREVLVAKAEIDRGMGLISEIRGFSNE